MHSATINETLVGVNGENLKTLLTTDFSSICKVNVLDLLPDITKDDIVLISNTIKNIIVYESVKHTTLTTMLEDVYEIIEQELYNLLNSNSVSIPSININSSRVFTVDLVETYNATRRLMATYGLFMTPYVEIIPIENTYNHELNRHFITIGVYECN